jgi:hypothetical protein
MTTHKSTAASVLSRRALASLPFGVPVELEIIFEVAE